MKVLELFAGTRSIGKQAKKQGHTVFSTDIEKLRGINLGIDVRQLRPEQIPFIPDMIWASPPCTAFSVASMGHHWRGGACAYKPRTPDAVLGMELLKETLRFIMYYSKLNPELVWFIENPRGVMRHMGFLKTFLEYYGGHNETVWYCKYGDKRAKPTDIWTNCATWKPRPKCRNYKYDAKGRIIDKHCHHQAARRGAKTGTQGFKNNRERSKIPPQLCAEVVEYANYHFIILGKHF